MSKTNEELNELKKEVEAVNEKLQELTPEEIAQVSGGGCPVSHIHTFELLGSEFVAPKPEVQCWMNE